MFRNDKINKQRSVFKATQINFQFCVALKTNSNHIETSRFERSSNEKMSEQRSVFKATQINFQFCVSTRRAENQRGVYYKVHEHWKRRPDKVETQKGKFRCVDLGDRQSLVPTRGSPYAGTLSFGIVRIHTQH